MRRRKRARACKSLSSRVRVPSTPVKVAWVSAHHKPGHTARPLSNTLGPRAVDDVVYGRSELSCRPEVVLGDSAESRTVRGFMRCVERRAHLLSTGRQWRRDAGSAPVPSRGRRSGPSWSAALGGRSGVLDHAYRYPATGRPDWSATLSEYWALRDGKEMPARLQSDSKRPGFGQATGHELIRQRRERNLRKPH
jgi:hypothetical protein